MAQRAKSASKTRSKDLTHRTRQVYEKVVQHEDQ